MKRLAIIGALCAATAWAGEVFLGVIIATSGADTTNATTATPFCIAGDSKLSIWCDAAAYISTDTTQQTGSFLDGGTNATVGVPVQASTLFPTSVGSLVKHVSDGGTASGCAILRVGAAPGTTARCYVYSRRGSE